MIIPTMTTDIAPEAERDIEVRGDWFRSVFDCLNDAVFIHDVVTGAILEVNQRACEMYGCDADEMRGLSIAALSVNTPPYTLEESLYWMRKAVEEGPQLFEWQARARSGRVFWVEVSMRQAEILGKDRLVVNVRDISKRKQAESELRRSEERFRTVLGNSKDPVYCLSLPTLTYDYISPAVEQVLGFSIEECIAGGLRFMFSRIHPEDYQSKHERLEKLMTRDLNGDFQPVLEYRFKHKNEAYRWISDNRSIVRDNEGKWRSSATCVISPRDANRRRHCSSRRMRRCFTIWKILRWLWWSVTQTAASAGGRRRLRKFLAGVRPPSWGTTTVTGTSFILKISRV